MISTPNHKKHECCNLAVASLLGLDVLGKAPCLLYSLTDKWYVDRYGNSNASLFVYFRQCSCNNKLNDEVVIFNHIARCLEPVPFYHRSDRLARQALEQICNERNLQPEMYCTKLGWWRVWLLERPIANPVRHVARGVSRSLPQAICKALVALALAQAQSGAMPLKQTIEE